VIKRLTLLRFLLVKYSAKKMLWEMRLSLGKRNRRTLMASIMLVAFASRVLIPPGFMPTSGWPFSIEICWEGLPADMLAQVEPSHADSMGMESMDMESTPADSMAADSIHDSMHRDPVADSTSHRGQGPHHHHGSSSQSEHCVFGTACSGGPIPHLPLPSDFSSAPQLRAVALASIVAAIRVVHLPQPRAPPSRLS
jgi:hypothetical protein